MGALVYEPEMEGVASSHHENFDEIANEIFQVQENHDDQFIDDLLSMNGSSAGARPKVVLNIEEEPWLIKFRSSLDPKDMGLIEYTYHLMAEQALLDVPKAKIFPSQKGFGYFGVRRFDRVRDKRLHMHTISGFLHADHRIPSLDYETILKATLWLTKDLRECEKQFRAAVFNVLSHNRDDHAKNFSFFMNEKGEWFVSPAYDLVFSSGPAGEHCTTVMGEGKNPSFSHLIKLAEIGGIKQHKASQIIDEVQGAVAKWDALARKTGVSDPSRKMIQRCLNQIKQYFEA